jgi:hypothetical protein
MNQSRYLTEYDDNYCGEISNTTYYEYQNIEVCAYGNHPPVIYYTSPAPIIVTGGLGQNIEFNIEANDSDDDYITYNWTVNDIIVSTAEDYTYPLSEGYVGYTYVIEVTATDDSIYHLSDSKYWNLTVLFGHYTNYTTQDFSDIVIDGVGTAGASFVEFVDLIVIVLAVLIIGGLLVGYFVKFRK